MEKTPISNFYDSMNYKDSPRIVQYKQNIHAAYLAGNTAKVSAPAQDKVFMLLLETTTDFPSWVTPLLKYWWIGKEKKQYNPIF